MSEEIDPGSGRPLRQYQLYRCGRCPHGSTLHEKNGRCLVPACECPGYEEEAVPQPPTPEGTKDPFRLSLTESEEQVEARREQFKLDHKYQEVVPNQMPTVVVEFDPDPEVALLPKSEVLRTSHHGQHYHGMAIEPIQVIEANGIGFHEGNVIKYVMRWKVKNGLDDLKKARFYLNRLIEITEGEGIE